MHGGSRGSGDFLDFRILTIGPASGGFAPEAFLTNVRTEVGHEGTP